MHSAFASLVHGDPLFAGLALSSCQRRQVVGGIVSRDLRRQQQIGNGRPRKGGGWTEERATAAMASLYLSFFLFLMPRSAGASATMPELPLTALRVKAGPSP